LSRIIEEKNKKITVLEEGQNPGGRSIRELKTEVELLKKEVISKDEIISDLRRQLKEAITLRDGNTNAECEKGLEVTKKEVADIEALGKPALEIETQSAIKEYRTQKHETSIQQEESQLSGENSETSLSLQSQLVN
jgi:bifunctional pyridoxal-dependent enzyme with beta-cystathionase and maltose regulon repressor activities